MRSARLPVVAAVATMLVAAPLALRAIPLPHLKLKASFPAPDTTLAQAPKKVELWFSEVAELPMSKIALAADGGVEVTVGKLEVGKDANSPSVVVPVTGKMGAGKYTVTWRAASKDGHPITGTYGFTVAK